MVDPPAPQRVLFLPGALRDFEKASDYYETQQRGLGKRFRFQVLDRLDAISLDPTSFPLVHAEIRETLVRRFPFAIYHAIREGAVVIVAIHHCSQDPFVWQDRLG